MRYPIDADDDETRTGLKYILLPGARLLATGMLRDRRDTDGRRTNHLERPGDRRTFGSAGKRPPRNDTMLFLRWLVMKNVMKLGPGSANRPANSWVARLGSISGGGY